MTPHRLIMEAHEGCSSGCGGCGVHAIASRKHSDMSLETAAVVARQLPELGVRDTKVIISGRGEPTLHRSLPDLVSQIRTISPRTSIALFTGGAGLAEHKTGEGAWPVVLERLSELFVSGVSAAVFNMAAVRCGALLAVGSSRLDRIARLCEAEVSRWPEDNNVAEASPWAWHSADHRRIILVSLFGATMTSLRHRVVNEAGVCIRFKERPRSQWCARPYKEMFVRWDGQVSLCQSDWRGQYILGSVHDRSLMELWHCAEMQSARRLLRNGRRVTAPCQFCGHTNVPQEFNNIPWDFTQPRDEEIFREVASREPATKSVEQPWEASARRR